jgi:glucosamine-6-phosphate deaminase
MLKASTPLRCITPNYRRISLPMQRYLNPSQRTTSAAPQTTVAILNYFWRPCYTIELSMVIVENTMVSIKYDVYPNHLAASEAVAEIMAAALNAKPDCIFGLATGSTPIEVYRELCNRHRNDRLSFAKASTYNLDEYIGLPPDHPQSYRWYMHEHLFAHVDFDPASTHLPDVHTGNAAAAAEAYERDLARVGGVDLQLLGIGTNGHIGFNEPGTTLDSVTRVVDLAESTIASNSRFFDSPGEVPRQAITMGIASILRAKEIVLMATGAAKADAVRGAIHGPVSTTNPASFLQTHPRVRFVLDEEAASKLSDAVR